MLQNSEKIIKQFQKGNKLAFRQIFEEYYIGLRSFSFNYTGDELVGEDFVQDAFLLLWENKSSFEEEMAIKSYLFTTVRNKCLNFLRHEIVKSNNIGQLKELESSQTYRDYLLEEEVHTKVYDAIKDLSHQTRSVVVMSMNGLSNPEIAAELEISVNTVKTIKSRAYKTLREKLKGVSLLLFMLYF